MRFLYQIGRPLYYGCLLVFAGKGAYHTAGSVGVTVFLIGVVVMTIILDRRLTERGWFVELCKKFLLVADTPGVVDGDPSKVIEYFKWCQDNRAATMWSFFLKSGQSICFLRGKDAVLHKLRWQ